MTIGTANSASAQDAQFTEEAIALEFAARYQGRLAFVAASTSRVAMRWYIHDENSDEWRPDDTLQVQWLVRELCQEFRQRTNDSEIIQRLSSRYTQANIELLARSDRRLARTVSQLGLKPELKRAAKKRANKKISDDDEMES
jgi:hypothetical protein